MVSRSLNRQNMKGTKDMKTAGDIEAPVHRTCTAKARDRKGSRVRDRCADPRPASPFDQLLLPVQSFMLFVPFMLFLFPAFDLSVRRDDAMVRSRKPKSDRNNPRSSA
jgi:hypothetical protein